MTDLWVDTRWEGRHGIGRYAGEVCSRLTLPWRPLGLGGHPSSPTGALVRVPRGPVYSPGYNALLRADQQILTIHDLIHLRTNWPGRTKYLAYYNLVVKPVVRRTGIVITVSETSRREIRSWLGDPTVEIVNAGIGASEAFDPNVTPAPAERPYLLYVGNLRKHKNVRVILDAVARVPDAMLRILIPEREHDAVRPRLAQLGIAERVILLPPLSDAELASHYRGASATIMPSTLEGFGLPALESVMTGTPVLYWRGCASVAETVRGRGTAIEDAHDVDEWSGAIEDALSKPIRVESPGDQYSWDLTARRVEQVVRRLPR